ncbi:MAG: polymer-forming cytoskeletal protein [Planctomycetota bacterium]
MALKPPLTSWKPEGPKPADARDVACPYCGRGFVLSRKAVSTRCPSCTRPLSFEDMHLRGRVEGDLSTMGQVTIIERSEMVGRLTCGSMASLGRFEGQLKVLGTATLEAGSLTCGEVRAQGLSVDLGATLRGRVNLGPATEDEARPGSLGNRLRPLPKRLASMTPTGAPVVPPPPRRAGPAKPPPLAPVRHLTAVNPAPAKPQLVSGRPANPRSAIARLARIARSSKTITAGPS